MNRGTRVRRSLALMAATAMTSALLLTIPPARAADPPSYYAVSVGLVSGVEVLHVMNDAGVAAGYLYSGQPNSPQGDLVRVDGSSVQGLGRRAYPFAISGGGTIVGEWSGEAFRADGSTVVKLGTLLGSDDEFGLGRSVAYDINEAGTLIVGTSTAPDGRQHGFVHDGTSMADLGVLPGGIGSEAYQVNGSGLIAGTADEGTGNLHIVTWSDGEITDLGNLGGSSGAIVIDLNEAGQILGGSSTSDGGHHAFVSEGTELVDLGTLGGRESYGWDINEMGQAVGSAMDASGNHRAFLWEGGSLVDLGTLGGTQSGANGINDAGQIVGWAQLADDSGHAFLIDDGVMYDLNDLLPPGSIEVGSAEAIAASGHIMATSRSGRPVILVPGSRPQAPYDVIDLGAGLGIEGDAWATDMNTSGEVTGDAGGKAFLYDGTSTLLLFPATVLNSYGWAINEVGQVAGQVYDPNSGVNDNQAFFYDGQAVHVLGSLGGTWSSADDLNDAGDVVGGAQTASGQVHAFVHRDGTMTDLGTMGGVNSHATRVNENGLVIGTYQPTATTSRGFVWDGVEMTDLGTLGTGSTVPSDINDAGQIVGRSANTAFLYSDGVMTNIAPPGSVSSWATAISENGNVAGYYTTGSGQTRSFLLEEGVYTSISGTFKSAWATDVDDRGRVIGYADPALPQLGSRAFLFVDGELTDLNTVAPSGLGYLVSFARKIAPDGRIIAGGYDPYGGSLHALLLVPTAEPDPDADGNGIWDAIEDPGVAGGFLDSSTDPPTFGQIVSVPEGFAVEVQDSADLSEGVRIVVSGTGTEKVTISVCGFTVKLAAGSDATFTCGSVLVDVAEGQVTIELGDGLTVVVVPTGGSAGVGENPDGTFSVINLGTTDITVVVDGVETTVVSGSTLDVTAWDFQGFLDPVDMPPVLNMVKAGQIVPLKWHLVDAAGAPILNLAAVSLRVSSLQCSDGSTNDQLEETGAGGSGLQNLGDGYYQYNWKTAKSYAGSCKTLLVDLGEGVERTALFRFTK